VVYGIRPPKKPGTGMSKGWAAHLSANQIAATVRLWWLGQLPSNIARQLELPVEAVGDANGIQRFGQ